MHGLNQEFLYSSVDIFRMHELNQEYLYSSVDIFWIDVYLYPRA